MLDLLTVSKMEKAGVFLKCMNLDSTSMIQCLQALLSDHPSIKFNSVIADKQYRGFKVFFSEPDGSIVLEKNKLFTEEPVWIYPLTAHLMINVDHKKTPLFERDLCEAIKNKFGKILNVDKKDSSNQSKNWVIEIDIPEFRGLEPFQRSFYSDITLPIPSRNEEVTVKLYCTQCNICGHFQHECSARLKENHKSGGQIGENFKEQITASSDQNSKRISNTFSNFPLEATERYAEKIGREEVMSFSKEKEKHVQKNSSANIEENMNSNLLSEKNIKKESVELVQNTDAEENKYKENKNTEIPENNSRSKNNANENISNQSRDSFSNDSDDIEFLGIADNATVRNSSAHTSNSSARADSRNFEEESKSSPEARNGNFSNFSFPSIPVPSHESPSGAVKTPRGAEVTTALSERLQDCINQVCANVGVLDRKKLDAFLIHVKKKSNPIRVALNYTANTRGLKEQLQAILHMYYNTPQTGTKEDIQFIKWLNGLVERYDGSIPKKRKRSGKTDDEPSTKR